MKKGFTLSEVLISLGIVGVVAVMTIPSVMDHYNKKMLVTQLQKVYNDISQAAERIMADERVDNFYETSASDAYTSDDSRGPSYFLKNYFKNTKFVSSGSSDFVASEGYKNLNGDSAGNFGYNNPCIRTKYGATICAQYYQDYLHIWVDVNGPKKPNIAGKDAFIFLLATNSGKVMDYRNGCDYCNNEETRTNYNHIGDWSAGCLTCIIENNWKMDY